MGEFLNMGGYASYVWTSYGLTLLVVGLNIWWAYHRFGRVKRRLTGRREPLPEPTRPIVREL